MKEEKISICQICNERKIIEETFHDLFLIIDDYYIKFKSIEQILSYQLIMVGTVPCNQWDFGNDIKAAKIYYNITEYPTYLFVLIDLKNYDNLKEKLEDIKRLTNFIIQFSNNIAYYLKGFITCSYMNHYTVYINNLNLLNLPIYLENNRNYYYDCANSGYFLEISDYNILINNTNPIIPYLLYMENNYLI